MKLNAFETMLMNNPLRSFIQRHYEAPRMAHLAASPLSGAQTLVLGCGRGVDIEIALDLYGVDFVEAVDIDQRQIQRAERRLGGRYGERMRLRVGDASEPIFEAESFDLVLDFGIIHHIPKWRDAIVTIAGALRPGGQFLFEEVPRRKLDSLRYRILTDHPKEDRFESDDFSLACEEAGLQVDDRIEQFFGFFRGAAVKKG